MGTVITIGKGLCPHLEKYFLVILTFQVLGVAFGA